MISMNSDISIFPPDDIFGAQKAKVNEVAAIIALHISRFLIGFLFDYMCVYLFHVTNHRCMHVRV